MNEPVEPLAEPPAVRAASGRAATPSRASAFSALFLIEMWERFGYYGMQVLLVVFMIEYLHFAEARANLTWGAFAAMVYATPVLGGWIGDKVLGAKRLTLLGAFVRALGYGLLSVPWDRVIPGSFANPMVFFSLGVIATGAGLFKPSPANLVSRLYQDEPSKLDSAFTMYYMSVNIGAVISQSATPWIRVHFGWHWAFLTCAAGLVLGMAQFRLRGRVVAHLGSAPDFKPLRKDWFAAVLGGVLAVSVLIAVIVQNIGVARAIVWAAGVALLVMFSVLISRGSRAERGGLIATLLLTAQTMLFFIFYQQMSTSLTLFALHNVRLDFFGYHVPPEQFQVLNPFWIAVLSPPLALLYTGLGKQGRDLSLASKFAWGFAVLAIGFFVYAISGHYAVAGQVSPWWMVVGYFLQSLGELLISGLGLAMISRYIAPQRRGLMMGAYYLATGIAQYFGSFVANFASVPQGVSSAQQTLPRYVHLFGTLGWVAVAGTVVAIALLPLLKRLDATYQAQS
jgi:POT family proton-dependent oligopeptide transporter